MAQRVFIERGADCVWISYDEEGNLLLSGQSLGGPAGGEYECQ